MLQSKYLGNREVRVAQSHKSPNANFPSLWNPRFAAVERDGFAGACRRRSTLSGRRASFFRGGVRFLVSQADSFLGEPGGLDWQKEDE
jgi:hypothetical protein